MKQFFGFLLLIFVLSASCVYYVFDSPQPKDAKRIYSLPSQLTGVYVDKEGDTGMVVYKDSVLAPFITSWVTFDLSDTDIVLRQYKNWYVLNVQDSSTGLWVAYPVKVSGQKLKVYNLYFFQDSVKMLKMADYVKKKYNGGIVNEVMILVKTETNKDFFKLLKDKKITTVDIYKRLSK